MLKTTERLSLILTLNKMKLDLGLLMDHTPDDLLVLCGRLEARKTPHEWYAGCPDIQKELVGDEQFFYYLEKLSKTGLAMTTINNFIRVLHENDESAIHYPIARLLSGMALTARHSEVFYDYFKFYGGLATDKPQKDAIIKNLRLHSKLLHVPIAELTDGERAMFLEPCLTETKLVPDNLGRALPLLAQNPSLLEVIRFIYDNGFSITLTIDNYDSIAPAAADICGRLRLLLKSIGHDAMYQLLRRWQENNCPLHDLETLCSKLASMAAGQIEDAMSTRSSYINLVYGGRISSIALEEIQRFKEDILIYAITAKKNAFIRLIEENYSIFSMLPPESILFNRAFYTRHMNLNSLNAGNLRDCGRIMTGDIRWDALEYDRLYTFDEIKVLHKQLPEYYKLYAGLDIPRLDIRLVTLRQLTKGNLLASVISDEQIATLSGRLSEKPLSVWRERDFGHINGLKPQDAVYLLICQTELESLIPQMKTRTDALLALRCRSEAARYNTIDDMKGDLLRIDGAWSSLAGKLGISEQFMVQNQERLIEFLCRNGADIANTYYNTLSNEAQRESLRRIVKAELMGEFGRLKYHADDLRLELDYPISDSQKSVWMENTSAAGLNASVRECDDFFSTMLIGTTPQRTCLSYIDGQYNECLLSTFDSNKKILYAAVNGTTVCRAIIRLTKGRFKGGGSKPNGSGASLSFVNLESPDEAVDTDAAATKERLVLFLERSYSSTITETAHRQIKDQFAKLMEQKACQLGAMLVLSSDYGDTQLQGFTRTRFHIYISRSKAGAQYLDSLNGSASVSDEGGYRVNNFFIRSDDIISDTLSE